MKDYKRIVSYIYTYENNEKKRNVGFGKLEARSGSGKLMIQVNDGNVQEGQIFAIYLLHIDNYAIGVKLGECRVIHGRIRAEINFETENIMQSGYNLSQIQGIYMTTEMAPYVVYASSWTEVQILPDKFRIIEEETESKVSKISVEETYVKAAVLSSPVESVRVNEDALLTTFMESLNELSGTMKDDVENELKMNEETETELYQAELCCEKKTPWEELCCRYPKVIAFEGETQPCRTCLKIDMKDLDLIIGAREINENIYLIRSYYKYKYLLLIGNDMDDEGESCILGIPGIYCRNEGNLAKMFGFEKFLQAKISENTSGSFGYWCKEITL